jgi:ERCC4-type nuclease
MSFLMPKPCIIVDTREKAPFAFDHEHVDVVSGTLSTGDCSLFGHEDEVAIERKSLDDLVGTLTHGRERFERELERMRSYVLRAVIIEGSWQDLADHHYVSLAHPSSIFGSVCCSHVDYLVPFLFCETRAIAGRVTERLIRRYAENLERNAEAAKEPAA